MTIKKSDNYVADTKARKLYARMNSDVVELGKSIETMLTAANAMRIALGAATLSLAEVEAHHVAMTHDKRVNDAMLFEVQTRLNEMLDAAKVQALTASLVTVQSVPKVNALQDQAKRIAEKDIVDDEPMGPLPGMQYVGIDYFKEQLACSTQHVRNLMERGSIPQPDAVSPEEGGRPKFLWLKHNAAVVPIS
jgi:hypothetical protein